jgi:hypothetical protein
MKKLWILLLMIGLVVGGIACRREQRKQTPQERDLGGVRAPAGQTQAPAPTPTQNPNVPAPG